MVKTLPYESLSNPSAILKIQSMMRMDSLPFPLNLVTKGHASGCRFVESIRCLCGSCELNVRRKLPKETAKYNNAPADLSSGVPVIPPPGFINCGEQLATPILECNCGWVLGGFTGIKSLASTIWEKLSGKEKAVRLEERLDDYERKYEKES